MILTYLSACSNHYYPNDFELMTSLQLGKKNKNVQLLQLQHNCRMPILNDQNLSLIPKQVMYCKKLRGSRY